MPTWRFDGKVCSKHLCSAGPVTFNFSIDKWSYSEVLSSSLNALIQNAKIRVELRNLSDARDGLLNLGKKGEPILSMWDGSAELSYIWFSYDANTSIGSNLFLVIGLPDHDIERFSNTFDQALFTGNKIQIVGGAWFSEVENNEVTKNPTHEEFECGKPQRFDGPVQFSVYSSETRT